MAVPFLFKGIAFPFQKGSVELPKSATDNDLIKQSLVQLVLTSRGERIMRPDFGTNTIHFVFEDNNELLEHMLRADITTAVSKFEPRALITNLGFERTDSQVNITLQFVVVATQTTDVVTVSLPTP